MRSVPPAAQLVQFRRTACRARHGLVAVGHGLEPPADLRELGPVDHQLAGQVHQLIQPVGVHPHGLRGPLAGCGGALVGFRERSLRLGRG